MGFNNEGVSTIEGFSVTEGFQQRSGWGVFDNRGVFNNRGVFSNGGVFSSGEVRISLCSKNQLPENDARAKINTKEGFSIFEGSATNMFRLC